MKWTVRIIFVSAVGYLCWGIPDKFRRDNEAENRLRGIEARLSVCEGRR